MKFIDSLIIALKSLLVNKLRSSLTMLGIIIGVGAVITLMSAGRGVQSLVTSTLEGLGTNSIWITSDPGGDGGVGSLAISTMVTPTLTIDDAEALANPGNVRSVVAVVPTSETYPVVTAGDESTIVMLEGTNPEYQQVMNFSLARGQFISDKDMASKAMVAVLGANVAKDLFGSDNPVGQRIKIKGKRFTVIGVLEAKGGPETIGMGIDDVLVIPITTYHARVFTQRTTAGDPAVSFIAVQVTSPEVMDEAIGEVSDVLRKRHRLVGDDDDDFAIITQEQILGILKQITEVFTLFLGAIAGIALLVGGIGIMNIMFVSVTERTREIGIRKAVGAKRRDILLQFLFEAAVLSFTGGVIGIIGGWALSGFISFIATSAGVELQLAVSPDIIVLAVSVSVVIGLVSGIYPAMRAARLNPIDALHYG